MPIPQDSYAITREEQAAIATLPEYAQQDCDHAYRKEALAVMHGDYDMVGYHATVVRSYLAWSQKRQAESGNIQTLASLAIVPAGIAGWLFITWLFLHGLVGV